MQTNLYGSNPWLPSRHFLRSMNEANERDPYNNNCYGTLVDRPYKLSQLPVLDVHDFNERIIRGYEEG